jgi:hypothetical protein
MPFPTTTAALPFTPVVAVEFAGQLLISSSEVNPCVIGINHFAPRHEISICLIVSKPGMPPTMQPLCLNKLEENFSISLDPPNPGGGVSAYAPTPEPFRRDDPNNDEHDLRWAIDMNKLHDPDKLSTNDEGVKPCVTLSDGVLYTIDRTDPDVLQIELVCGSTTTDLVSIASNIGAIVPLTGRRKVVLAWSEPAGDQEVRLPRENDPPGTTYVISVINEPPFGTPPDNELAHYYNVLQKDDGSSIPSNRKCALLVNPSTLLMTDEIPCMPVIGP